MIYTFGDDNQNSPKDIYEDDYYSLLQTCFTYSKYFSLRFKRELYEYPREICDSLNLLNPYMYRSFSALEEPWCGGGLDRFSIYHCNANTYRIIKQCTNKLFAWMPYWYEKKLPEDPTFFREDGSVFYCQVTHEDIAELYPLWNEDVHLIVSKKGWRAVEKSKIVYNIPISRYINPNIQWDIRQKLEIQQKERNWINWLPNNLEMLEKYNAPDLDKFKFQKIMLERERERLLRYKVIMALQSICQKEQ